MIEEAKKIASTFHRLAELPVFEESPCEVLSSMAVVLRTRNTEMVCLDISVRSNICSFMLQQQGLQNLGFFSIGRSLPPTDKGSPGAQSLLIEVSSLGIRVCKVARTFGKIKKFD